MATEICLTLQFLSQKIEKLLKDYSENFYDLFLTFPDVRQQLLSSVLIQLPHGYLSKNPGTICFSLEGEYIDDLIRRIINQTLQEPQLNCLLLAMDAKQQHHLPTCVA